MILKKFYYALLICFMFICFSGLASAADIDKTSPGIAGDDLSVTKHAIEIKGASLRYTATAGTFLIKDEEGKPKANFFFTAYTKDGIKEYSRRPVTFVFNGGPGSASAWLHMGAVGPRKPLFSDKGFPLDAPWQLVDNEYTLLDITDIVCLDPVSTGYSRAVPGEDPKQFHGTFEDVESVGDFIHLYITRNERWISPKFILGESYGTNRAAGLSGYLQGRGAGMYLNGIILVSCTSLGAMISPDMGCILDLPHYTATAWYHKKLPEDLLKKDLHVIIDEAEKFALGEYNLALIKGNKLPEKEKADIVNKLAKYTGLTPQYIINSNLRITVERFRKELLRNEHKTVGRLDSRYKGVDKDSAGENYEYDPANAAIYGPIPTLFNHYIRTELKYKNDITYAISGSVRPWNRSNENLAEILRKEMNKNKYLNVFLASGYYDGCTRYFRSDYLFSHLGLNGEFKDRFKTGYYEAGHMMYIHKPSHAKFKKDIAEFIISASSNQ